MITLIKHIKDKGSIVEIDGSDINKDCVNVGVRKYNDTLFDVVYFNKSTGNMIGIMTGFFKVNDKDIVNELENELIDLAGLKKESILKM